AFWTRAGLFLNLRTAHMWSVALKNAAVHGCKAATDDEAYSLHRATFFQISTNLSGPVRLYIRSDLTQSQARSLHGCIQVAALHAAFDRGRARLPARGRIGM